MLVPAKAFCLLTRPAALGACGPKSAEEATRAPGYCTDGTAFLRRSFSKVAFANSFSLHPLGHLILQATRTHWQLVE